MNWINILQTFALVTFLGFLILQIFQSKYMWYLYIPSCIVQAYLFFTQHTWAFAVLNLYYVIMGFQGIRNYRKDRAKLSEDGEKTSGIHLHHISKQNALISLAITVVGIPALYFTLSALNDAHPLLDAITTTLSVIGTWWLTKSYLYQWIMWIIADVFAVTLNLHLGLKLIALQFLFCIISSFFGLWNWHKNGVYVDD